MTDQECDEVFHKIVDILKESQFSGLINRTEEQINEGKITEDEVKTFKETFSSIQTTLPLLSLPGSNLRPSIIDSFCDNLHNLRKPLHPSF